MSINFKNIKIENTEKKLCSFSGLIPFSQAIENSFFIESLKNTLPIAHHGYETIDKIKSLMYLIFCGGKSISDVARIDSDVGIKELLGIKSFPKANTLSTFLNGKITKFVKELELFNLNQMALYYKRNKIREVTLDIDSTLIENKKYQAKYTYKKFKGYNPMYIVDEKNKKVVFSKMRNGNASPQSDILSMLKIVVEKLKTLGIKTKVRIDSAGYQVKIVEYLHKEDIAFSITGDNFAEKIEFFKSIKEKQWKKLNPIYDVSSAYGSIASKGKRVPVKMVIKRKLKEQPDLIEGKYFYYYIITNIEDESVEDIVSFHNQRGNAENIFKELKTDFLLDDLPCDEIEANGVFMQILNATFNIFQMSKEKLFSKQWRKFTLKTIRYRIICVAGLIVEHARETKLLLNRHYIYFNEFLIAEDMSRFACF